jgi:hypothetical protein
VAQDRGIWWALVDRVMNFWVPINCWELPEWLSGFSRTVRHGVSKLAC